MQVRIPLLAVSGAAWVVLLLRPRGAALCSMPGMGTMSPPPSPGALTAASALMFVAMMLPLLGAPVRHVRDRSFARRRPRAVALFLGGYGALWTAAGVVLMLVAARIVAAASAPVTAGAILAIAIWQCSPAKQRCLNRCHLHPGLAAFGRAADLDALRFGLKHGAWCIASCSGLMLLPLLVSRGHIAPMAGITLWLWSEKLEKPMPLAWRVRGPAKAVRVAIGRIPTWRWRSAAGRAPNPSPPPPPCRPPRTA
jgi:predicted metal-binding membrane protein